MTLEREKHIKIPIWLVSVILPIIVSAIVGFGIYKGTTATITEKVSKDEKAIERLESSKVGRDEMNLIIISLQRIENKLDAHIAEPK